MTMSGGRQILQRNASIVDISIHFLYNTMIVMRRSAVGSRAKKLVIFGIPVKAA